MSSSKYKEWILETIDQLRKRKARPDAERICYMIERRHGLSFREIEADLQKLVEEGVVIKVDYKGSTSYRNAAKWKRRESNSHEYNRSKDRSLRIQMAVLSVCDRGALAARNWGSEAVPSAVGDPVASGAGAGGTQADPAAGAGAKKDEGGASMKEIESWLLDRDPDSSLTEETLMTALNKEVEKGHLEKSSNGNYSVKRQIAMPKKDGSGGSFLAKSPVRVPKTELHVAREGYQSPGVPVNVSNAPILAVSPRLDGLGIIVTCPAAQGSSGHKLTSPGLKKARGITKRKKIKKSLGPEFEAPPYGKKARKVERPQSANGGNGELQWPPLERCDFCLSTARSNKAGKPEDLLVCKDCQAKAHPSCMEYSEELAKRARNSPWQCIDCKTCYICHDSNDPDAMLFCDACDKGYHMRCHSPPVEDKPTGKWVCSKCEYELDLEDDSGQTSQNQGGLLLSIKQEPYPDGGGASCLPTPSDSPVYFMDDEPDSKNGLTPAMPKLALTMKAEVPDASAWTIDDVVHFFVSVGFAEQAEVFSEQEIDGKSLLLLKRNDVLNGLSLKLGPALKIYAHVQRLQTRGQMIY